MRYAGGRPLWHLSLSAWDAARRRPAGVLRWSPTVWRKIEAMRDRVMRGLGTDEPYVMENMADLIGAAAVSVSWRKPLRVDEVNRMAPTPEALERKGRA